MIKICERFLYQQAEEWNIKLKAPINFFIFNNYHLESTNINIFWFQKRQRFPFLVTRLSHDGDALEREYDHLCQVESYHVDSAPRPLHYGPLGGFFTMWMTGLPGTRFQPDASRLRRHLDTLISTVLTMHSRLRGAAQPANEQRVKRVLDDPINSVLNYKNSTVIHRGYHAVHLASRDLVASSLPVIPQHGDLFLGNILWDKQRFYFVDWEEFNTIDLPCYDIFTLLLSILQSFSQSPAAWPKRLTRLMASQLRRYAAVLGLSSDIQRVLLPLTLANWFHRQYIQGHQKSAQQKYTWIENYFEHEALWQEALL